MVGTSWHGCLHFTGSDGLVNGVDERLAGLDVAGVDDGGLVVGVVGADDGDQGTAICPGLTRLVHVDGQAGLGVLGLQGLVVPQSLGAEGTAVGDVGLHQLLDGCSSSGGSGRQEGRQAVLSVLLLHVANCAC